MLLITKGDDTPGSDSLQTHTKKNLYPRLFWFTAGTHVSPLYLSITHPQKLKKIAVIYLSVLRQNTMEYSRVPFRLDIRNIFFYKEEIFYHECGGTL